MAQLFANKHWLDLALAVTEAKMDEAEVRAHLHKAGIAPHQHEDFLQNVRILEVLRVQAQCHECDAPGAHLDENTLAEFVDGVLEEHEVAQVERQFAQCASCLRKAVELAQLTEELIAAPRWPEVVLGMTRRGLSILAQPLHNFMEQPLQAVPVLGDETDTVTARSWTVQSGHLEASFIALMDEDGAVSLTMQVMRNGEAVKQGRAMLRHQGALVEALPLNHAEARFTRLRPGAYIIEVETGQEHSSFSVVLSAAP